jgi:hypothetical protein
MAKKKNTKTTKTPKKSKKVVRAYAYDPSLSIKQRSADAFKYFDLHFKAQWIYNIIMNYKEDQKNI